MLVKILLCKRLECAPEWAGLFAVGWSPIRPAQVREGKMKTSGAIWKHMHCLAHLVIQQRGEQPWKVLEVEHSRIFWWDTEKKEPMMGCEVDLIPTGYNRGRVMARSEGGDVQPATALGKPCLRCKGQFPARRCRGLCPKCYTALTIAVRLGKTTYEESEKLGLCLRVQTREEISAKRLAGIAAWRARRKKG